MGHMESGICFTMLLLYHVPTLREVTLPLTNEPKDAVFSLQFGQRESVDSCKNDDFRR